MEPKILEHREIDKNLIHLKNELKSLEELGEFDVIGFDIDHTLVRYNVANLARIIEKWCMKTLMKDCEGYPDNLLEYCEDNSIDIALNGAILDYNNDIFIKLSEDCRIMRAFWGFTELEDSEIEEIYGKERHFEFSWWKYQDRVKGYEGFHSYVNTGVVSMISKLIEIKKNGLLHKTCHEIIKDIELCILKNIVHFTDDKWFKIREYGELFPEICKNLNFYVQNRPDYRESLQKLKAMGKKIFAASNSHAEYANLTMTQCIGEDWREFFDFVVANWGKPKFFKDVESITPFYRYTILTDDCKEKSCNVDDLCGNHIYLEGNVRDLEKYFQKMLDKEDVKFVYIGDNYISDGALSNLKEHWKGIALIEELNFEDPHADNTEEDDKPTLVNYKRFWGSYFEDYCGENDETPSRNIWVAFAEKECSFTISLFKDFEKML